MVCAETEFCMLCLGLGFGLDKFRAGLGLGAFQGLRHSRATLECQPGVRVRDGCRAG